MPPRLPAVGEAFRTVSRDEEDGKAERELCRHQNSAVSQWVCEKLQPEGFCQKYALIEHLWRMPRNILRDRSQRETHLS